MHLRFCFPAHLPTHSLLPTLTPPPSPIKHPLVDPRTTGVCLITKDPQREYKDLLEAKGVKFVSKVIGISKLKGKFKPFEARRILLKEHGMFLADDRVIPLLPKLLGGKWFDAKKCVFFSIRPSFFDVTEERREE